MPARNKDIPFEFIFDYLLRIDTTVKPSFGMFYIYEGPRLLLILRQRANQPEMNGIWVPTDKDGAKALKKQLPALRPFPGLGPKATTSNAIWLVLPPDHDDFERTAIAICDLLSHRDPRIGRNPK